MFPESERHLRNPANRSFDLRQHQSHPGARDAPFALFVCQRTRDTRYLFEPVRYTRHLSRTGNTAAACTPAGRLLLLRCLLDVSFPLPAPFCFRSATAVTHLVSALLSSALLCCLFQSLCLCVCVCGFFLPAVCVCDCTSKSGIWWRSELITQASYDCP